MLTKHKKPNDINHILDLVITRDITPPIVSNFGILPELSDHYAIMCNLSLCKPKVPTVTVERRQWKKVSFPVTGTHLAWIPMSGNMKGLYVKVWINRHLGKQDQSRSKLKYSGSMKKFLPQERFAVSKSEMAGKWQTGDTMGRINKNQQLLIKLKVQH